MKGIPVDPKELHKQGQKILDDARKLGREKIEQLYKQGNEIISDLVKTGEEFVQTNPIMQNQTVNRARVEVEETLTKVKEDIEKGIHILSEKAAPVVDPIKTAIPKSIKDLMEKLPFPSHCCGETAQTETKEATTAKEAPVEETGAEAVAMEAPKQVEEEPKEPFEHYDAMNVHKIIEALSSYPDAVLEAIKKYETITKDRKTIYKEIERLQKSRAQIPEAK